ncbi:protein FMC1 homolog isoform X2 [Polistes fuscatus]|uniref:protein FMC1 homolog isoform X2 n=1 Tax=Polistes fuscatus TaxID=30207 RepID=UPI001CA83C77|nr:protein FMC1 homolog isoform X2 [Polistes fuscatus]
MSNEEFILVNRRKKRKKFVQVVKEQLSLTELSEIEFEKDIIRRKIIDAVLKLRGRANTMNSNVKIIRALAQELRHISLSEKIKDNITMQYILEQARSHKETSEVLCKAQKELKNLAETYLCYLTSQKKYKEIKMQYSGKGERSIKDTADLVGFKLPHDPK